MNIYSVPPLIGSVLALAIGLFVWLHNKKSETNITFGLYNFSVFLWLISYAIAYSMKVAEIAGIWCRVACIAVMFIAPTFYHFALSYLGLKKEKRWVFFSYLLMLFFAFLFRTEYFLKSTPYKYYWGYYSKAGILHPIYLLFFLLIITRGFFLIWKAYRKASHTSSLENLRLRYIFLAYLVHTVAGVDYIPKYGIEIYPFGWVFAIFYSFITAYAIVKYHLMDIRIFISRAVAFLISYSLLLVVPFFFAYRMYPVLRPILGINWWLVPVGLLTFFATIAPFAYEQIRRGMENTLLAEQKRYQKLLLQAASGMVREHNLRRLAKLIVYMVKRLVKIDFAAILLYNKEKKTYELKALRDSKATNLNITFLEEHNFISYLKEKSEPLLYEELPAHIRNLLNLPLAINLIVPSAIENNLLGFVVLGEKLNHEPYLEDDINVFKILSHQAAMAIENCLFFEEFKSVQQKIFTAEKLASIGGMADGVAHQIKNRLNHFSIAAGEMQCEIKDFIEKHPAVTEQNPDLKKSFDYVLGITDSLIDNVKRTDSVIKGILGYARTGDKEEFFTRFPFKEILATALDLVKIKHEIAETSFECNIDEDDTIYGIKVQLMESLFNLLDNHYEAIIDKKNKLPEEQKINFIQLMKLKLIQKSDATRIEISDNGIGIKEEDKFKIFAPFFTTKSSYKSGSGIGMYVVKRIIEENHKGKIWFTSEYMKGTTFYIELPRR